MGVVGLIIGQDWTEDASFQRFVEGSFQPGQR